MYSGEKLNSITHVVGAALALMCFGALLAVSVPTGNPLKVISGVVFGLTLVFMYSMSALYHSFSIASVKRVFQKLDHMAIYLLIAGTYTPYMLITLGEGNGFAILTGIWLLALIGLLIDWFSPKRMEWLQIPIYLVMGWACVIDFSSLKSLLPEVGLYWLIAGGLTYTLGVLFYVLDGFDKLKHAHGVWHLFVLIGSLCHFISVIGYVL